jgi:Flp pilus assembly protein TadD
MLHHQAGRTAEAEACYRRALAIEPAHAEALHLLGLLAQHRGQPDLAVELIGRAIQSAADRPTYYANLGTVLQMLGRIDEAIQRYRQAIALAPEYPEAHHNLGFALVVQGDRPAGITSLVHVLRSASPVDET